ncbi:MAG: sugar transferase [Anaerolineae bacterium]|nr:MAG: sugar transferase [Anaerolineae bacterium]
MTESISRNVPNQPLTGLRTVLTKRWTLRSSDIRYLVALLPILDAFFVGVSLALAYNLRFNNPWWSYHGRFSAMFYSRLVFGLIPIWIAIFALYNLYHPDYLFGGTREYSRIFNASTFGLMSVVLYSFLFRDMDIDISRGWLLSAWGLSISILVIHRFAFRRLVYSLRCHGLFCRRVAIVGANEEGEAIWQQFRVANQAGIDVIGFVDDTRPLNSLFKGIPILGRTMDLKNLVQQYDLAELIVIPTALSRETLLDTYRTFGTNGGATVRLSPGVFELFTTGVRVTEPGNVPLVELNKLRITGIDAVLKQTLDYVLSAVGLIMLAPLFLLLAIAIKLDSPGTAFHRRRDVGAGGKEFDAFKFRTMRVDADEYLKRHLELEREFRETGKIKDDPRITRLGRILRKTSLDELPQLINILRGEMSLVGPRMITQQEMEKFGKWQHNRMTVKPGLTGLWQVSGRSDLPYSERARLDMYYIRNYTIWQDIRILIGTVNVVLRGRGAY